MTIQTKKWTRTNTCEVNDGQKRLIGRITPCKRRFLSAAKAAWTITDPQERELAIVTKISGPTMFRFSLVMQAISPTTYSVTTAQGALEVTNLPVGQAVGLLSRKRGRCRIGFSADRTHLVDRRLAIALAVALDRRDR